MDELYHHGVLGQRWGVRKKREEATKSASPSFHKESLKQIKINSDGSKTIPSSFIFNRVGKASLDVNQSGGLYVSYGKEDAARYIKNLGPTPISKLLGTSAEVVQHISAKTSLKMPSDSQTASETAKFLLNNNKVLKSFNDSIYSVAFTNSFDKDVTTSDIQKALSNASGKDGQKLSYSVSSFLGDPSYAQESKAYYEHFRKKGYDAVPDAHDVLSGTSTTAMIIINPNKIKVDSKTVITKDVMKTGKNYVKSIEKLKISDLIL